MAKEELSISFQYIPGLNPLGDNYLGVLRYDMETSTYNNNCYASNQYADIKGRLARFHNEGEKNFEVLGDQDSKYRLEAITFYSNKSILEHTILPLLKDNKYLLPLPSKHFRFNQVKHTFMQLYNEVCEMIKTMDHPEHVETFEGKPFLMLRPNNLSHSVCAFKVIMPERFRMNLFSNIIRELQRIWALQRSGHNPEADIVLVRQNIEACGLLAVSSNTFGLFGTYQDKMENMDFHDWILSPFIEGESMRFIKGGDTIHLHQDMGDQHNYCNMIQVHELSAVYDDARCEEIRKVMDNPATWLAGAMDIRITDDNLAYFIETSHGFCAEYYPESFLVELGRAVTQKLNDLYDKEVKHLNADLDVRLKAAAERKKAAQDPDANSEQLVEN